MARKLYVKRGTFLIGAKVLLQGTVIPNGHGMSTKDIETFVRNGTLDFYDEKAFTEVKASSEADRAMHAEARQKGETTIVPTHNKSPMSYNPKDLENLSMEQLLDLVTKSIPEDLDVEMPATRAEALAVLTADFEG